ncbi:MAG: hypothetical protein IT432_04555 [Phycisphaerales bacterium]|nr:hypothetical protein [Phycisphaerales bacterium]
MVQNPNLRIAAIALSLLCFSATMPMAGCERKENKAEVPPPPKLTPEQIEQQRVEEAKKAEAADRQLAAESAVKTLLAGMGEVKSVSFEPFKDSDQDDYGNQGRGIRSRFAAEVEAPDDLVAANNSLQWQDPDDRGQYHEVPVLRIVAPKGTKLLVTGSVSGKAVAGKHIFQAQSQEVSPASGVVLPATDNRNGFDPRYALKEARLRSTFKEGVLDGSPEHQKLVGELKQKEKDRRDAERRKRAEQRDREIAELVSVMSRLAASGGHLIVGDSQGGSKTPWLFSRSFSNLKLDAATGDGTGTMTDWQHFPPTTTKITIKKLTRKDDRFGEEQENTVLAIEPEEPGFAYLFERADGANINGRRVRSLTNFNDSGDYVSLMAAGSDVPAAMAKWQAAVAKVPALKVASAKVLDKAGLQDVMKAKPFVDGEFAAAKLSEQRSSRLEIYREDRRGGGYELYNSSTLLLRSAEGVAVRSVLLQLTKGAVTQPELVINGKPVTGLAAGSTEGGVLVEFSEPTTLYEIRFGAGSNNGNGFSVAVKLGSADGAAGGSTPK